MNKPLHPTFQGAKMIIDLNKGEMKMNLPEWKLKLLLERIKLEANGDSVDTDDEDFDLLHYGFWSGYNTGSVEFAKGLLQFLEGDVE